MYNFIIKIYILDKTCKTGNKELPYGYNHRGVLHILVFYFNFVDYFILFLDSHGGY